MKELTDNSGDELKKGGLKGLLSGKNSKVISK